MKFGQGTSVEEGPVRVHLAIRSSPVAPTLASVHLKQNRVEGIRFEPLGMGTPQLTQLLLQCRVGGAIGTKALIGQINGSPLYRKGKVVMDTVPAAGAAREQGIDIGCIQ